MSRRLLVAAALALALLGVSAAAAAAGSPVITIGALSQQLSPSKATASATITATSKSAGTNAKSSSSSSTAVKSQAAPAASRPAKSKTAASSGPPPPFYPALPANSPLLRNQHPLGPTSFWYQSGPYACIYLPGSSPLCYTLIAAGNTVAKAAPAVNPAALAAQAADTLPLSAGSLAASPSAAEGGLTGAASWFWLSPVPATHATTVHLDGEQLTLTATAAAVSWSFGDGGGEQAGGGLSYRPGAPPPQAVVHAYLTRCLPGDRGRNPNILASCGARGYQVEAVVHWQLHYQASGPLPASGSLPERTTQATLVYPVDEARAFLIGAPKP